MPVITDDFQQWTEKDADHWLDQVVRQLPVLPPLLRYYDDFDDTTRVIHTPAEATVFTLHIYGGMQYLDFSAYEHKYAMLLRHLFVHLLAKDLHASTVAKYLGAAQHFSRAEIMTLLMVGQEGGVPRWMTLRAADLRLSFVIECISLKPSRRSQLQACGRTCRSCAT